jgi:hypothetical protein
VLGKPTLQEGRRTFGKADMDQMRCRRRLFGHYSILERRDQLPAAV